VNILFLSKSRDQVTSIIAPLTKNFQARGIDWRITTNAEEIEPHFSVVYLLSYDRVVNPSLMSRVNGKVILFHSSDLPHGRGWAPIYNAIISQADLHTITMCYAGDKVDTGNILAKARLPIARNYTAAMLREVGRQAIGQMISRYTQLFIDAKPLGIPQLGNGTYVARRKSGDAAIDVNRSFAEVVPHLLASEAPNLASFEYRGERFRIQVIPENAQLRDDLIIEEYFSGGQSADNVVEIRLPVYV
jgi:methionyl-tRNA formyltransferase